MTISATPARHLVPGFLAEDAVGVVVEMDGSLIYHSGDTEYDRSLLQARDRGALSAALVSINGTGGNMNPIEAACLVAQLRPACAVPMHFGLWESESTADSERLVTQFTEALEGLDPSIVIRVPSVGVDLGYPASVG
jgi:L-ascorbate metabolism protein UlaG (beta-lactamase superfamily)